MDTNVLVAALRSRRGASYRLLQMIDDPRLEVQLSSALFYEYQEVAEREAASFWVDPSKVNDVLDYICARAHTLAIYYSWRPTLPDPDDDMILELAVAAGASYVVTHNRRDFAGSERFGIEAIGPRDLLMKMGELP